jgi:hypothetical protein
MNQSGYVSALSFRLDLIIDSVNLQWHTHTVDEQTDQRLRYRSGSESARRRDLVVHVTVQSNHRFPTVRSLSW